MSEKYDATERALADTLASRSNIGGHADMPAVYGRARSIRRRRTAGAVAAAAAVVAMVAVPLSLIGDGSDSTTPPVATQTDATSTAPQTTTPSSPTGSPVTSGSLADLKVGAAPAISYVHGDNWINNDGSKLHLPTTGIQAITPYHGGFMVLTDEQSGETGTLVLFDNTGKQVWSEQSPSSPVVTRDIYNPFWSTKQGSSTVLHTGIASGMSDMETTQTVPGLQRVVGVLPDGRVVYSGAGTLDGAWASDLVKSPTKLPTLDSASAASSALPLVAGIVSGAHSSSGAVIDVSTGKTLWTTSAMLGRFSPDGKLIVGYDEGTGTPALYDAQHGGQPLCTAGRLFDLGLDLRSTAWEDPTHLLLAVADQNSGSYAVLRVGLPPSGSDCTIERAHTEGGVSTTPYVLSLQP